MRTFTFLSTLVALLLVGSPLAAAQTSPAPSQSQKEPQEGAAIRSIQVVDVRELKGDVRSQVDALVAHTMQEQMNSLRKTIDATAEALSALKAKGRSSAQVVAVNIDKDGVLTLFTKVT